MYPDNVVREWTLYEETRIFASVLNGLIKIHHVNELSNSVSPVCLKSGKSNVFCSGIVPSSINRAQPDSLRIEYFL